MNILKSIWNWITRAAATVKQALTSGTEVANEVKAVLNSPILDAIVALTPTGLDDAALKLLRSKLATFIALMGWSEKIITDFEADPDAKATVLTAISAKASVIIADIKGAKLSIQEALASTPVVYQPDLVSKAA